MARIVTDVPSSCRRTTITWRAWFVHRPSLAARALGNLAKPTASRAVPNRHLPAGARRTATFYASSTLPCPAEPCWCWFNGGMKMGSGTADLLSK